MPTRRPRSAPAADPVVLTDRLTKSLGGKIILSNVSLSVDRGDIVGITGPVGAGKSSLLHILTGLMTPDSGTARVFGIPSDRLGHSVLRRMNYASSGQRLSGYASVWENLTTYALLYGVASHERVLSGIASSYLPGDILSKKVFRLSSGENSLVNLCKSLINDPDLLLLDEITAHMDDVTAGRVRRHIRSRSARGKTVIMISQNLDEILETCGTAVVLNRGRVSACVDTASVTRQRMRGYFL